MSLVYFCAAMKGNCFKDTRCRPACWLRPGLMQLLLCLSVVAYAAPAPFYAEIYLPRARVSEPDSLGTLQLFDVQSDSLSVCFEADHVALRDSLPRSLFCKMKHRRRLAARWMAGGDTLTSKSFVLSPLRSDVVIRATPGQLHVRHVRYFLHRYRGRLLSCLAMDAASWAVKLLVAWLMLCFMHRPRRILRWAAPVFAVTTLLCHWLSMGLLLMLILPVLIEAAVLVRLCRNYMGPKDMVWFVCGTQLCSFGLIQLVCLLPGFM